MRKLSIMPVITSRRTFLIMILLVLANVFQSVVIWKLLILSHEERFILVGNVDGGLKTFETRPFYPTTANISYFIRLWARRLLSVDVRQVKQDLSLASAWTRGIAVTDMYKFVQADMPGKRASTDKNYERAVSFNSLVLGGKGDSRYADLTITLIESRDGNVLRSEDKMMHIDFFLLAPSNEREAQINPLGLFVTHFSIVPMNAAGLISK